jgi:hypothetical protein
MRPLCSNAVERRGHAPLCGREVTRHAALTLTIAFWGCGINEVLPGSAEGGVPVDRVLGDGTLASVELVTVFRPDVPLSATGLDFNPARRGELWIVLRQLEHAAPCNRPLPSLAAAAACDAYQGSVAIVSGADGNHPTAVTKMDSNAWHFMRLPPAIAFGKNDTFATCGEARTANWDDDPGDFMGPTLWSSDPKIFAIRVPGQNGSHIDMLHASPFGMGIAHERDNVYWVFNGQAGALDRYDFHAPHAPGGEDHLDGEAWRWALGEVSRVPGLPSHLAYDARDASLYVADTGHGRVVRVDTKSGHNTGALPTDDSQMPVIEQVDGATIEETVPSGLLERPSGIALVGDALLVTDDATSRIHLFDLAGHERQHLDTGLPPGSLAGIAVGPDGKAYFVDLKTGSVTRIDPI